MKHIKTFETYEDTDTMARYQLYGADCFVSFSYRDLLIKDKNEILELIKVYNKLSKEDDEWVGGPVSKQFDKYFIDKYKPILGDILNFKNSKGYKPQLGLTIDTDYGFYQVGFSLKTRKMSSIYLSTFDKKHKDEFSKDIVNIKSMRVVSAADKYDTHVLSEMKKILNKFFINDGKSIDDLLSELNLNIDFDWKWND